MKLENPILKVVADAASAELVGYHLESAGALAIEERDADTMTASALPTEVALVAGFPDRASRDRAVSSIERSGVAVVSMRLVDEIDDDWQTRWRDFFEPVVLDRLQVITPWMTPPRPDRVTIVIDPGQAFGTGGHDTTKLILEMLEAAAAAGTLPERVLDVGTGSGVLAFAAAKLGARQVLGVDIDPASIAAFEENAARNHMSAEVSCRLGQAADVSGQWPLVLANIQIDAFRLSARDLADRTAAGGTLLISGILTGQETEAEGLFPGFEVVRRSRSGEWSALALMRALPNDG